MEEGSAGTSERALEEKRSEMVGGRTCKREKEAVAKGEGMSRGKKTGP